MKKRKYGFFVYFCITLFGGIGIYLTFISGNPIMYDSKVKAYRIEVIKSSDSDGTTMYAPIYYYGVNGSSYSCKTKFSSSSKPNENKKTVYYNSNNPTICITDYEKSSNRFFGIICLIMISFAIYGMVKGKDSSEINKGSNNVIESDSTEEFDLDKQRQLEENMKKVEFVVNKVQLIVKRIILGIIIFILLIVLLFDTLMVRQTIKARNYIDTTAVFVERKDAGNDVFDDCIYSFTDKNGNTQEIVVIVSKDSGADDEINIKYNENNPEDYYQENSVYNNKQIIFFVIKIVIEILLIFLFFNKKLLSKFNLSIRTN